MGVNLIAMNCSTVETRLCIYLNAVYLTGGSFRISRNLILAKRTGKRIRKRFPHLKYMKSIFPFKNMQKCCKFIVKKQNFSQFYMQTQGNSRSLMIHRSNSIRECKYLKIRFIPREPPRTKVSLHKEYCSKVTFCQTSI